jgi:hypothetical protein
MNQPLPNAGEAWVEEVKILRYLLSREHPEGGPKAKFFLGRGFTQADWEGMADALRHHAKNNLVVRKVTFPFGIKYTLDCNLPTPDKSNPCIRTVWEVRPDDERPRLITAHPLD